MMTFAFSGRARSTASVALLCAAVLTEGCSVRRFAMNRVGDALAGSGRTFATDDDPELVREAVPFGLKLMESVLAETPHHRRLLLATCRGFAQYAYAFVHLPADELETTSVAAAKAQRERARRLYLRARDYGLRALELNHRGFRHALETDPKAAVARCTRRDVPVLYWTGVAWAGAIAVSKDKPEIVADLPKMIAMMDRVLELDEAFEDGAVHSFHISLVTSRPDVPAAQAAQRARQHLERARALTGGQLAAPMVAYAEAVCIAQQNRAEFVQWLQRALAVDVEARPEWRLANTLAQRRARWLLGRLDDLFAD